MRAERERERVGLIESHVRRLAVAQAVERLLRTPERRDSMPKSPSEKSLSSASSGSEFRNTRSTRSTTLLPPRRALLPGVDALRVRSADTRR